MEDNLQESASASVEDLLHLSRKDLGAAEARHRQSFFMSVAFVLLLTIPVEAYIVGGFYPLLVLVALVWAATFAIASVLTRRYGSTVADRLDLALSLASSVILVVIVGLTGGGESALLPWCLVLPVAVSVTFARRKLRASVVSSLVCGLPTIYFIWTRHPGGRTLAAWGQLVFASAFISIGTSLLQVRVLKTIATLSQSRRKLHHQRVRSDRERTEARRLALIGHLAAGVAHEVNNPLSVVKANLGFAQNEIQSRLHEPWCRVVVESLGDAAGGVERIRLLVRDLADLSPQNRRVTATEDCEPEELVADAMDLVGPATSVTIVNETESGLPSVRVVRHQLVQVLRSLLHNAVDAVEGLPVGRLRRVVVRAIATPNGIQFEIDDTGAGFSDYALPRLFEPFFTTKPIGSGRGLNLAKAREHVIRSGGTISAENLPNGGARLSVRFPAATAIDSAPLA
jgi:two-component system, NtrC family, sensor kinase